MSADLKTHIEALSVYSDDGRRSVHVTTDDDLSVKFNRGEVCRGNNGDAYARVALVLGIDKDECHVIELSGNPHWGMRHTLNAAKAAIEMALEGYAKS